MFALRDRFPASMSTMLLQTISRRLFGTARAAVVAATLLGVVGGLASTAAAIPYPTPSAQIRRAPAPAHKKRQAGAEAQAGASQATRPAFPSRRRSDEICTRTPDPSTPTSSALPPPPAQVSTPQQPTTVPLSPGSPITSAPLQGTTSPTSGTTPTPDLAPLPFAPTSVWNEPLSPTAALDPGSARWSAAWAPRCRANNRRASGRGSRLARNIYVVGPNQPTVPVQLADTTGPVRSALQAAFMAVPIPPGAQPESDSDEELSVWQPSTDKLWEFFHMQLLSDGWHATWGGAMDNVAQSPGYYNANSWPGASNSWGATASSLPRGRRRDHDGRHPARSDRSCARGQPALSMPDDLLLAGAAHRRRRHRVELHPRGCPPAARPHPQHPGAASPEVRTDDGARQRKPTESSSATRRSGRSASGSRPRHRRAPAIRSTTATATRPRTARSRGMWPNQLMSYFPWSSLQVLQMTGPGM